MSTGNNAIPGPLRSPNAPTPGVVVVGWLMVAFSVLPFTMAGGGDGRSYLWVGLLMAAPGLIMAVVVPRLGRRT